MALVAETPASSAPPDFQVTSAGVTFRCFK